MNTTQRTLLTQWYYFSTYLDGGGVDDPLGVPQGEGYGILGHDCLPCRGVR